MCIYILKVSLAPLQPWSSCCFIPAVVPLFPSTLSHYSSCAAGFGCKMRTLDSGIGTIPLPESCSFFSSILHLLPKSSSTPEQSLSPPSVPGSSSEDVSPSPLPRWRIPSSFKDGSHHTGVPNSLSDSSVTHVQSVPFPTVAFLQPIQPQYHTIVTSDSVCDTQSRLPRSPQGTVMTDFPARRVFFSLKNNLSHSCRHQGTISHGFKHGLLLRNSRHSYVT